MKLLAAGRSTAAWPASPHRGPAVPPRPARGPLPLVVGLWVTAEREQKPTLLGTAAAGGAEREARGEAVWGFSKTHASPEVYLARRLLPPPFLSRRALDVKSLRVLEGGRGRPAPRPRPPLATLSVASRRPFAPSPPPFFCLSGPEMTLGRGAQRRASATAGPQPRGERRFKRPAMDVKADDLGLARRRGTEQSALVYSTSPCRAVASKATPD